MRAQQSCIVHADGASSYVGKEATEVFAAYANAAGIRLYAKTGLKPCRGWTVRVALEIVRQSTGMTFKRTQLVEAAQWLVLWANAKRFGIRETSTRSYDIGHQYAVIRWMLDYPAEIKQLVEHLRSSEIFDAIDEMARDRELIDPFTDEGVMMTQEERDSRKKAIMSLRQIASEVAE